MGYKNYGASNEYSANLQQNVGVGDLHMVIETISKI